MKSKKKKRNAGRNLDVLLFGLGGQGRKKKEGG